MTAVYLPVSPEMQIALASTGGYLAPNGDNYRVFHTSIESAQMALDKSLAGFCFGWDIWQWAIDPHFGFVETSTEHVLIQNLWFRSLGQGRSMSSIRDLVVLYGAGEAVVEEWAQDQESLFHFQKVADVENTQWPERLDVIQAGTDADAQVVPQWLFERLFGGVSSLQPDIESNSLSGTYLIFPGSSLGSPLNKESCRLYYSRLLIWFGIWSRLKRLRKIALPLESISLWPSAMDSSYAIAGFLEAYKHFATPTVAEP